MKYDLVCFCVGGFCGGRKEGEDYGNFNLFILFSFFLTHLLSFFFYPHTIRILLSVPQSGFLGDN